MWFKIIDSKLTNFHYLELGGGLVEVRAGEVLRLECSGVVDPLLADSALYSWTKDGAEVDEGWVHANHSLAIPYLLAQHAGIYVCQIRTLLDIIRNTGLYSHIAFTIINMIRHTCLNKKYGKMTRDKGVHLGALAERGSEGHCLLPKILIKHITFSLFIGKNLLFSCYMFLLQYLILFFYL